MIVVDAVTTLTAVCQAAVARVQLAAGAAAMVLCALPLCIAPGVKAARKAASARRTPEQAPRAPESTPSPQRRTQRPTPSWAHTDHHRHEDAA